MLYKITRNIEFYNPLIFIFFIPLLYANSLFFDYILFGKMSLSVASMSLSIDIDDNAYLYVVINTFLYCLGVFLSVSVKNRKYKFINLRSRAQPSFATYALITPLSIGIIVFTILIYLIINQIAGLERTEIKSLSASPVRAILTQMAIFFLCYALIYEKQFKTIYIGIIIILLGYSTFSFERENMIYLIYALLLRFQSYRLSSIHVFLVMIIFIVLFYYKVLISLLGHYIQGEDIFIFVQYLSISNLSISDADPSVSILLTADVFNNIDLYSDYYGSYVINTGMQFIRTFIKIEWTSLGEFATEYYTQGSMGTAFSMIVESILNFWYFGPFLLGYLLVQIFYKFDQKSAKYYKLYYFIWLIFIVKFVRTELAVVLKLYILPAIIAYYIYINLLCKSKK